MAVTAALVVAATARGGTEPVMVTTEGGNQPTVSPDGGWVAYQISGGIVKIPAAGGEVVPLASPGREPDWSRTGDLIVYRTDDGIYTVDAITAEVVLVAPPGGWDDDPVWSPLGDEIALQSSSQSIALLSYPGGGYSLIPCVDPDHTACEGEGPTWSPDGQWLAFEDGTDILKIARTGGTAIALYLYVDSRDVTQPAWSPDGRWIAFARHLGGELSNIWIMDSQGADLGLYQVTDGAWSDTSPAWSPDSGSIYFTSNRSGTSQIWRVEMSSVPVERKSLGGVKGLFR